MTKRPIDLDFRPGNYFKPQKLAYYLLANVKGAVVREKLQALLNEGRHAEVSDLLGTNGIPKDDHKALERLHPMFMGGNYLPDMNDGEIEIARIRIASTTYDVVSVYARQDRGVIHYRIVDEYIGETLVETTEMTSSQPLTLGEFTDFFLNSWRLTDCLISNFDDDLEKSLAFFVAESNFYPDFDRLCRQRVVQVFADAAADNENDI